MYCIWENLFSQSRSAQQRVDASNWALNCTVWLWQHSDWWISLAELCAVMLSCLNGMSWYLNTALCSRLRCFKAAICIPLSSAFLSIVSVEWGRKTNCVDFSFITDLKCGSWYKVASVIWWDWVIQSYQVLDLLIWRGVFLIWLPPVTWKVRRMTVRASL